MSSLLGLKRAIPELVVQVSNDEGFVVRGLTPQQVFGLYRRHTGELSTVFDRVLASANDTGGAVPDDVKAIVMSLFGDAPILMGELIVLGSGGNPAKTDEFEAAYSIASAMPFPVQVDALAKIAQLTFTSEMPAGKFAAFVLDLIRQGTKAIQTISRAPLPNGSGGSDAA